MKLKTYPPDWNNRKVISQIYGLLTERVNELETHWAEEGISGLFVHFRGTDPRGRTYITDKDIAGWLISFARVYDRPVHPIVVGAKNRDNKSDHFHAILGIPIFPSENPFHYKGMVKALNATWKQGHSEVMYADFGQLPFSPLEYIPGKHNWIQMSRKFYVPRHYLR